MIFFCVCNDSILNLIQNLMRSYLLSDVICFQSECGLVEVFIQIGSVLFMVQIARPVV